MKKLLIAGMLMLSVAAINATGSNAKQRSDAANYNNGAFVLNDTTMPDTTGKDTTGRDSATQQFTYQSLRNLSDTTAPTDTTKKDTTQVAFLY